MTNPGTFAPKVLVFTPSRKFEHDRNSGRLLLACIATVFWIATAIASLAQGFTPIHDFAGYPTEGAWTRMGLIQATDGNFYGTTNSGGDGSCTYGCGTAFEIAAGGAFNMLFNFDASTGGPSSGLIQANDGNFYGTTGGGGGSPNCYESNGCGTVYEITPAGTMSTLYSFNEPAGPSGVIQASDGNFYGTTYYGGDGSCSMGCGTIFSVTPEGALTTLYSFPDTNVAPGGLLQGTDGNFYGTTLYGGAGHVYNYSGNGTVFELTPTGTLTMLYSFCGQTNCTDGGGPTTLIQAADGNFYGTTLYGGAHGSGTVFKVTSAGALTTIYSFCAERSCMDGSEPTGLIQAADGNFYGTTLHGGGSSVGTIFEIMAGTLTRIYKFGHSVGSYPDGANPFAGVVQAADGSFYGTTAYGGNNNCSQGCGTVFTFGLQAATLSRTALKFGREALNESSAPKPVTMENSGVALLAISNVTVTGDFAISANTCTGATLINGMKCHVSVAFTPTAVGLQTGTLSFTDNSGNSPQAVALSGTGIEPAEF